MKKWIWVGFVLLWAVTGKAQYLVIEPDSFEFVKLTDYIEFVVGSHPVLRQSELVNEMGRRELQMARGGFDPKLSASFDEKKFAKKTYYSKTNTELKIPTWVGADVKAGFETLDGEFTNPQDRLPENGLAYAGIELPIGRGLLFDERRTILRQAQVYADLSVAEQLAMANKLYLTVVKDFYNWALAFEVWRQNRFAFQLSLNRYAFVSQSIKYGDLAQIDSVEALIEVQKRDVLLTTAWIELNNARLIASNHLWDDSLGPLILDSLTAASLPLSRDTAFKLTDRQFWLDQAIANNPDLRKVYLKRASAFYDRKLAAEWLKPDITLSAAALRQAPLFDQPTAWSVNQNYKLGVNITVPLLLRKERGKFGLTNAKLSIADLDIVYKQRELQTAVEIAFNDLRMISETTIRQQALLNNTFLLRNAEQVKFENGESSLFLVNSRERKLIDEAIKLAELQAKYEVNLSKLRFMAGMGF